MMSGSQMNKKVTMNKKIGITKSEKNKQKQEGVVSLFVLSLILVMSLFMVQHQLRQLQTQQQLMLNQIHAQQKHWVRKGWFVCIKAWSQQYEHISFDGISLDDECVIH